MGNIDRARRLLCYLLPKPRCVSEKKRLLSVWVSVVLVLAVCWASLLFRGVSLGIFYERLWGASRVLGAES